MRYLEHVDTEEIRRGLMTHGGWISVEDRLPKSTEDVLVYVGEYGYCDVGHVDSFGWHDCMDEEIEGVTHWMPLPAAPRE